MKPDQETETQPEDCGNDQGELASFRYLLGDFGIAILTAIARGARTNDAIMMLSGVPMACVNGRIPVLLNLNLVVKISLEEYAITTKGSAFLKCINECI